MFKFIVSEIKTIKLLYDNHVKDDEKWQSLPFASVFRQIEWFWHHEWVWGEGGLQEDVELMLLNILR